jgi:hypothetical protein
MREGRWVAFANHGLPHSAGVRLFDCGPPDLRAACRFPLLAAQTQLLNQGLVTIGADAPEIVEQTTALAHELEQSAPRMVVLRVRLEVRRQLIHALSDQSDLHLGGAGVGAVRTMRIQNLTFLLSGDQGLGDLPASPASCVGS